MGMTIDEAMNNLSGILTEATEDEDSVCYVTKNDAEALQVAIDAICKYQKVTKILNSASYTENGTVYSYTYDEDTRVKHIREVIEDGVTSSIEQEAIPISWLEEKLENHPELSYVTTDSITNVLDFWELEKEK